jgi:hypothetical protein
MGADTKNPAAKTVFPLLSVDTVENIYRSGRPPPKATEGVGNNRSAKSPFPA